MTRRIDHLVIAVRDLDGAGEAFGRLGFVVGGRNRHPWGTENRLVQFQSSFLELITLGAGFAAPPVEPGGFSFAGFVRDYLGEREGLAMLVLDSSDAALDADRFRSAGIGAFSPFSFGRRGVRPDGSSVEVGFSLAFARDEAAAELGFFVCQNRFPENFWLPDRRHPCGASDVSSVLIASPDPARHSAFLSAFAESTAAPVGAGISVPVGAGSIEVATAEAAAARLGSAAIAGAPCSFAAFSVRIDDVAEARDRLEAAGVTVRSVDGRLVVPVGGDVPVPIVFEADRSVPRAKRA